MLDASEEAYVAAILEVARRDAGIARVLREICALDAVVRSGALDLVGAHLRTRTGDGDVFQCLDALRRDEIARRIAQHLGPAGPAPDAGRTPPDAATRTPPDTTR
jgi:hypothetical protein